MKKKNFDKLEKKYLVTKGINKYFVENESRRNDFNEILIINLWVIFQNIKIYNRKTLKIEKDGFSLLKEKKKKWLNLANIKIEKKLWEQSIEIKKLIFIIRKIRKKLKKKFWETINLNCCIIKGNIEIKFFMLYIKLYLGIVK